MEYCHPDPSAAEWRDLLFVWAGNHATPVYAADLGFKAHQHRRYFFFPVLTEVTFTVGTTIGRRIGTSPAPGCCCCCIRASISVRT